MKTAIPLGAILLVGIATSLLRAPIVPARPERSPSVRPPAAAAPVLRVSEGKSEDVGLAAAPTAPASAASSPAPAVKPAPAGWAKMLGTLDRAVGLTVSQQPAFEQLLREREKEIQGFLSSIRSSGILDVRDYEWRSDLMKESWYRRMDALLDGAQHGRFLALLEKGFLNEGLELTIEPGMTVLD